MKKFSFQYLPSSNNQNNQIQSIDNINKRNLHLTQTPQTTKNRKIIDLKLIITSPKDLNNQPNIHNLYENTTKSKNTFYDNIYDKYHNLNENNKKSKLILNENHQKDTDNNIEPIKKLSKIAYPVKLIHEEGKSKKNSHNLASVNNNFENKIKDLMTYSIVKAVSPIKKSSNKSKKKEKKNLTANLHKEDIKVDDLCNNLIRGSQKEVNTDLKSKTKSINEKEKGNKRKYFCCF